MLGLSVNLRYFLCCTPVDMRNGFDGLAGIVRNKLKNDPISGSVFVFLNKTRTHIKLLYWDGDGFALHYLFFFAYKSHFMYVCNIENAGEETSMGQLLFV